MDANIFKVCAVVVLGSLFMLSVFFLNPSGGGTVSTNFAGAGDASVRRTEGSKYQCDGPSFESVVAAAQNQATQPRVLVTGAAGFIGSHIAEFCAAHLKFKVVVVDDLSGGFTRNVQPVLDHGGIFVKGDVQNDTFIRQVFADHGPFDHVYHIAAYAAEGLSHFIRKYNYENNLVSVALLVNAAVNQARERNHPVKRLVFTSSIAAYGAVEDPSELPMVEKTLQRPEDPYGISKHAAELDLRAAKRMFGQDFIIFRPHNVYGPRQNIADKFRNAIGIFMNQIMRNEQITIFGDGKQTRAFSYIDDVAPVIAASVLYPAAANEDFFVGVDDPYSVNDLADIIKEAMHVPNHKVVHLDARKEVVDAYASHAKLRCFFKPRAPTSLKDGVARVAAYAKEMGSFEPKGYLDIEVNHDLPPSWSEWLKQTKKLAESE